LASKRKGVTFFEMLRDALVASLRKGQFPMAVMGLIAVIAVCRMPAANLSQLVFRILDAAEAREYGGYALSVMITLAWAIHGKRQRREFTTEVRRLSDELDRLQQLALDVQIRSSRRGK